MPARMLRGGRKKREGEVHPRELNPQLQKTTGRSTSSSLPTSSSWQRMLIQKSLDRVKRGELTLAQVAMERFGSVEALEAACKRSWNQSHRLFTN